MEAFCLRRTVHQLRSANGVVLTQCMFIISLRSPPPPCEQGITRLQLPCSSDSFDTAPSCHLCSVCLRPMPTRRDGTIRVHGLHSHRCLGSGKPPSHPTPSACATPSVSCISNSDSICRPNSSLDETTFNKSLLFQHPLHYLWDTSNASPKIVHQIIWIQAAPITPLLTI